MVASLPPDPMSLRPVFPLALAALILSGATLSAADPVEAAHAEIWRRFISPHGTFYDYTSLEGGVELPTAAEVAADQPNALGWWSPIENGGFSEASTSMPCASAGSGCGRRTRPARRGPSPEGS